MGKITFTMLILGMFTFSFADGCFFQTRRASYDTGTSVKSISWQSIQQAYDDIVFYDENNNNYARYYERQFGREGNLIVENQGNIQMLKFYHAVGEYRLYGIIEYRGAFVKTCETTTSARVCDATEYTEFAMYLRDFLSSSARKNSR